MAAPATADAPARPAGGAAPLQLALFDLDHTLIPFDSGGQWLALLVARGVLPPRVQHQYLAYCHQYAAGTLDIHAMHAYSLGLLRGHGEAALARWQAAFAEAMRPRLPPAALALVRRHQQAGDLCAIVTATTRLVAQPLAQLFGVTQLVCTEARQAQGLPQPQIEGLPCFRAHKLARVQDWLAGLGHAGGLASARRSWFYSDSVSDLPLLQAVTDPVAVAPDARLAAHAAAAGWPVIRLA